MGVLARKGDALGELAEELDDLGDVVVVLAVAGARGGIEEVVAASDEFEQLRGRHKTMFVIRLPK